MGAIVIAPTASHGAAYRQAGRGVTVILNETR